MSNKDSADDFQDDQEGWGQMCTRIMAEADDSMEKADEALALLLARRSSQPQQHRASA